MSWQRPLAWLFPRIVRPSGALFKAVTRPDEVFPIVYPGAVGLCDMLAASAPSACLRTGCVDKSKTWNCFRWDRNVRAQA